MKTKGRKSSMDKIFLLLVSMATLAVMATGIDVTQVIQDPSQNQTQEKMSESETGKNGSIDVDVDVDLGDLAFEREETKHRIIMMKDERTSFRRNVECRGENVTSLSIISCDTMDICEEQKACLLDETKCSNMIPQHGEKCTRDEDGRFSFSSLFNDSPAPAEASSSTCFQVIISRYDGHSGIIQCTSEEAGKNVTTFDHYTIGYSEATLLSTIKNVTNDLVKVKLYVASVAQNLIDNSTAEGGNLFLYVDEEVTSFECSVPNLFIHKEGITIRVHRKDGSTVYVGPGMNSTDNFGVSMKAELRGFRVSSDIVGFSCSAQRTNSSGQWLENRINVTVRDLPSEMSVKSGGCKNMTVNLTSGAKVNLHCELTGPSKQKEEMTRHMRKMNENYYSKEVSSTSTVEFVRLSQVAGEHLSCETLNETYFLSGQENPSWKTQHEEYYGGDQRFHFIFNLAPSVSKIYKPENPSNPSSSIINVTFQENVEQTLLCQFSGEPQPGITWMKNGKELFFTKSMGTVQIQGKNETVEHVKLPLNPKVIQPIDFQHSENGRVNFSCIARNYFGSDRLDYIITVKGSEKSRDQAEAENPTKITTTAPTTEKTATSTGKTTASLSSSTMKSKSTSSSTALNNQTKEVENSNSNSTGEIPRSEKSTSKSSTSNTKHVLAIFLTVLFAVAFFSISAYVMFALWKKPSAGVGGFVAGWWMFRFQRFQNNNENDGDDNGNFSGNPDLP